MHTIKPVAIFDVVICDRLDLMMMMMMMVFIDSLRVHHCSHTLLLPLSLFDLILPVLES
eukprot:SAG11_NODE_31977_length_287_cov_1.095745_1_plen_58_part_01